jgi:hypothetical protein
VVGYRRLLHEAETGNLHLENTDCDTGRNTAPGEYKLADETYAHLLRDLSDSNYMQTTPELKKNVLAFYSDPNAPLVTKRKRKDWDRVQSELQELKNPAPAPAIQAIPAAASSSTPTLP